MNSIRYPKYIYSIGIILIIFIIIYYVYRNLNKTIEGATTGESDNISTSPIDAAKSIKQQIIDFAQELYDTVHSFLTSKTKQSESKTIELLKKMDEAHKNIELPGEIDPEIKKQIEELDNRLIIQLNTLKFNQKSSDTGVSIEILPEEKNKISGIVNTYL